MWNKRLVCAAAAVSLMILSAVGFAAGKLTVTHENFYPVQTSNINGYVYAQVKNTGDKPVRFASGLFEVYDDQGDSLASTTRISVFADYLQPGEYGYVKASAKLEEADTYLDAADHQLTVAGKGNVETLTHRFPCEGEYEADVEISKFTKCNYVQAVVTNDTDEPVYEIEVVLTLLDDAGEILDIENVALTSSVAIMPGSSVCVRKAVASGIEDAYTRAGYVPAKVDAIAYSYEDE